MDTPPDHAFFARLCEPFTGAALFDHVADTVYFVKDREARYVAVNTTLAARCGVRGKAGLIGRRAADVFPAALAERIARQDRQVLAGERVLNGELELHLYAGARQGWCLTWKHPLRDGEGIAGLCGISRDLALDAPSAREFGGVAAALDHVNANLDGPLRVAELAALASLSAYQLDQRVRALFGISTGQYVTRARIDAACHRLAATDEPISEVALACGYADQGAFTRQFRKSVGMPPGAYREQRRGGR